MVLSSAWIGPSIEGGVADSDRAHLRGDVHTDLASDDRPSGTGAMQGGGKGASKLLDFNY